MINVAFSNTDYKNSNNKYTEQFRKCLEPIIYRKVGNENT